MTETSDLKRKSSTGECTRLSAAIEAACFVFVLYLTLTLGIASAVSQTEFAQKPSGPIPAQVFTNLAVGGGGNIDGQSIPKTGVRFIRTDVFGGYLWGTENKKWNQIVTENSMPRANFGYYPENTNANQIFQGAAQGGVMEIAGCPSDASCAYMFYNGLIFHSSNVDPATPQSLTWCNTGGFRQVPDASNASYRGSGPFMAIDPKNADHIIVGTESNGLFETFNGSLCGGAIWRHIDGVPQSTNQYRIAFDPTAFASACPESTRTCTSKIYVWTNGGAIPAIYVTQDAGQKWIQTAQGPALVNRLKVSVASEGAGTLWATDTNGILWRYAGAQWAKVLSGVSNGIQSVAISAKNGNHLVALTGNGDLLVSINGTYSHPTFVRYRYNLEADDAPWQAWIYLNRAYLGSGGDIDFDPLDDNELISEGGQGIWSTLSPANGSSFTWRSIVSGIEGLIFSQIQVGTAGEPSIGAQDETGCTLHASTNRNATTCFPLASRAALTYASSLTIPPGHAPFMVAKISANLSEGIDYSGYSIDGFKKSYIPFNTWYETVQASDLTNNGNGLVRVKVRATAGLATWSAGQGSILCNLTSTVSSQISRKCFAITVVDQTHFDLQSSSYSSAISEGDYAFYVPAAPMDSWNGKLTVANVTSQNGSVRIINLDGQVVVNGAPICISGAVMKESTIVNGCWIAEETSYTGTGSEILGPASHYLDGDAYVTGGVATTWGAPGGSIAAGSKENWVSVGADSTYPHCTEDSGAHWSQINISEVPVKSTMVTGDYYAGTTSITVSNAIPIKGAYEIWIPLKSGRVFTDQNVAINGNKLTFHHSIPPGDQISNEATVSTGTGWPFAAYLNSRVVVADTVSANTFFAMNTAVGLLKWNNCNTPIVAARPFLLGNSFLSNSGANSILKAVPDQGGHLFWMAGPQGGNPQSDRHPGNTLLWRTCNGANNVPGSVTFSNVPGMFEPIAVGFGHPAPGHNYPVIYVAGWYSRDNSIRDAEYGIWKSIDDKNTNVTGQCQNGNTWKKIGTWPGGWMSFPHDIEGDPYVYGPLYYSGSYGAFFGVFN